LREVRKIFEGRFVLVLQRGSRFNINLKTCTTTLPLLPKHWCVSLDRVGVHLELVGWLARLGWVVSYTRRQRGYPKTLPPTCRDAPQVTPPLANVVVTPVWNPPRAPAESLGDGLVDPLAVLPRHLRIAATANTNTGTKRVERANIQGPGSARFVQG